MAIWLCGYVDKLQKFKIPISCFLIDMKFISKLFSIFPMGSLSFSNPHLHKKYVLNIWSFLYFNISRFQNFKSSKSWVHTWSEHFEYHISKDNIFPRCFHILSNILWGVLVSPKINKVGFGSRWQVKTLRNHGIWSFGLLKWWNRDFIVPIWSRLILGSL